MRVEQYFIRMKRILFILYALVALGAIIYQLSWQERTQRALTYRKMMEENGWEEQAEKLLKDACRFPVTTNGVDDVTWYFEDGYGASRSYGGNRSHEGVDIMASKDEPGCLQIRSVCDGVIEQMGWLRLGGYRIGIRSDTGFYYYYAHMERYAGGLHKGDRVKAGELIGYMGNTGYGKEGTKGKFAVHLHFGIYYTENDREKSLNPYPFLWYLEQNS
ncbi:MAG: peptidoglycan DD-metalloendopeptidase family protein [Lachnospiraceae bacterium]|nr:peptidoglycan DD-metalloendopeptidase family protein [Lachnospiraceae bacterium]